MTETKKLQQIDFEKLTTEDIGFIINSMKASNLVFIPHFWTKEDIIEMAELPEVPTFEKLTTDERNNSLVHDINNLDFDTSVITECMGYVIEDYK